MYNFFKTFSIKSKNLLVFSVILGVTLCCYGLVFYYNNIQKSDSILVDISGKNRMLSQRIGAMAQLVGCANDDIAKRAKEELVIAIQAHQNALNVLRDGGTMPGLESGVELPNATGTIRNKIVEIDEFFSQHKELVAILLTEPKYLEEKSDSGTTSTIQNPVFNDALIELQNRLINGILLKHNIELTAMFMGKSQETKSNFIILLLFLVILNLSAIGGGYFLFNRFVTNPIRYLSEISKKISKGDAGIVSTYRSADNIGQISDSINILTDNIRKSAEFTIKIGKGDFSAAIDMSTSENIKEEQNLALALTNMKNRLVQVADDDKKRKWVAEGLAHFGDILRGNEQTEVFANNLLKELIKYINANQGGLFILTDSDNENQQLELIACYAYDRRKFVNKTVQIGEGLVGQAVLEKDMIYITKVPNNYVNITSGLGEATPRCILILPLKNNEIIEGVLEIASFQLLQEHEIQFVEKVADSIASAFSNIRINDKTRTLLLDSQQQSEELKAQEEEMRQNMEEMQATQEEMKRKTDELNRTSTEMTGIIKVIDYSMINIEFEPDGTIITANGNFLKIMNYTLNDIKGKHHRIFAPKEVLESEEYKTFWTRLSSGDSFTGIFKRKSATGETVWLNAIYNSILNANGEVVKVVKFANDITTQQEMVAESKGVLGGINATMATIEFHPDGTIVKANDNFLKTMKYSLDGVKGKHHSIFAPKEVLESAEYKTFWKRLSSGESITGIFKRVSATGETVWLNAIYNPILNASGEVVKVVKFANDITTQQEIVAESKGVLGGIDATMATIEFQPDGTIITANDNFLKTMKYLLDNVKGKHHSIFAPQEVLESAEYKTFWKRLSSGESITGIFKRVSATGETVWLNAIYNPILNASGEVLKVVKFANDITNEKQKEAETIQLLEETTAQEEELRQTMEELLATQEGVERLLEEKTFDLKVREDVFGVTSILSESDVLGNILYANSKLSEVSKYGIDELIGKPHNIFRHPDMPKELFKLFWETLKKGETFKGIIKNKAKDGTHYWVDGCFVPVKDANGKVFKYIGARYHILDDNIAVEMYNKQALKIGVPLLG